MNAKISIPSFLFLFLLSQEIFSQPGTWQPLGPNISNQPSLGTIEQPAIAIDGSNIPYVAYIGAQYEATVRKYENSVWIGVGDSSISRSPVTEIQIAVGNNNRPYVVYVDESFSPNNITVQEFNGTNWVTLGNAGFATGEVEYPRITIDKSGTPYVVFFNSTTSLINVMQFNGSQWVQVGNPISPVSFNEASGDIAIDKNGILYLSYSYYNSSSDYDILIYKLNGANWVSVGTGIAAVPNLNTSITIDSAGEPCLAFNERSDSGYFYRYNGANWAQEGTAFSADNGNQTPAYIYIAIGSNNFPYVSSHSNGRNYIMYLNGTNWVNVGGSSPSSASTPDDDFVLDNDSHPYVTFTDSANLQCVVEGYISGSWHTLGGNSFFGANSSGITLATDNNGIPYMIYADGDVSNKATVRKYYNSTWELVGKQGFSVGEVEYTGILFDANDTPYVSFADYGDTLRGSVMKFDGDNWLYVGQEGFSEYEAKGLNLSMDKSKSAMYVGFEDYNGPPDFNDDGHPYLMQLINNNWKQVGNTGGWLNLVSMAYPCGVLVAVDSSGVPYAAIGQDNVEEFNGNTWSLSGTNDTNTTASVEGLIFKDDTLFIFWADGKVMKYNGNKWVLVASTYPNDYFPDFYDPVYELNENNQPYMESRFCVPGNNYVYGIEVERYYGGNWISVGDTILGLGSEEYPMGITISNGVPIIAYCTPSGVFAEQFVPSIPTGILNAPVANYQLLVIPNPCSACVVTGIDNPDNIEIIDIVGRRVPATFSKSEGGYAIDFQGSNNGFYLLHDVKTGQVVKFIKE